LEDDWQSVVTSAGDLSEKHRQQQTAIWELLSTEIAYIRTLRVITNVSITSKHFPETGSRSLMAVVEVKETVPYLKLLDASFLL
jgi:hypothetical protein